jgi:hypothetical protein
VCFLRRVAHAVDLALGGAYRPDYRKGPVASVHRVITYAKSHCATAAAWEKLEATGALLLPGATRFGADYIMCCSGRLRWGPAERKGGRQSQRGARKRKGARGGKGAPDGHVGGARAAKGGQGER